MQIFKWTWGDNHGQDPQVQMHILGKHKIALITTSNNEFSNVKIVIQKDWTFVKDHYFKPKGLIKLEKEIIFSWQINQLVLPIGFSCFLLYFQYRTKNLPLTIYDVIIKEWAFNKMKVIENKNCYQGRSLMCNDKNHRQQTACSWIQVKIAEMPCVARNEIEH